MIRKTEVDGVPTLLAATSGPPRAGLTFRVGRADETLATAGITHLVEHLALFRQGLSDYHFNGATGTVATHFHVQGSDDVVAGFLSAVCDSLVALPIERLEIEKSIIRAEAASRSYGAVEQLPLWRYGARDYGLDSYQEVGLPRLGADELHHWAATWFTRANAVLWIAGRNADVPAGLKLNLPDGVRRPVPTPSSALPATPAYFVARSNGVAFDAVIRRRLAGRVFAGVLERELFRQLRQDGGYSYAPQASYSTRGDGYATITVIADAVRDKDDAVLGGVVDILAKLRHAGAEQGDLDAVRAKSLEALGQPDAEAARLPSAAIDVLTDYPDVAVDEFAEQLRAVTLRDVHDVAVEVLGSTLLMAPRPADWAGYAAAPTRSASAVDGRTYSAVQPAGTNVVVGGSGVSAVCNEHVSTVRFDDCAAALAWPDGARQITGHDGMTVRVEPTLLKGGAAAVAAIDAVLAPHLIVPMPARQPDQIPRAGAVTGPAAPPLSRPRAALSILLIVVATLVGCLAALCTLGILTADPAQNPEDATLREGGFITTVVLLWLVVAAIVYLTVRVRRPRRR